MANREWKAELNTGLRFPSLIHERVHLCAIGQNPQMIARLESGWVVLGDDQRLPGYVLLLSDPVASSLNSLATIPRQRFLLDMARIGDSLMELLKIEVINYSILGNSDRALHAHIHPRFATEIMELRRMPPWFYHFRGDSAGVVAGFDENGLINGLRGLLTTGT